jgi:ammonia channel protein AmtB
MMTDPGLALFDGGLVRTKNVVSRSDAELHLQGGRDGGVGGRGIWPGVGGNGILSVICVSRGSTNAGGAPRADYAPTIPQQTVIVYQPMFAIITSALIPGVFGERMKFSGIVSASNRSERPRRRPRRGRGVHFRVIGIWAS